jgi:Protein of unknown function (DUF1488)
MLAIEKEIRSDFPNGYLILANDGPHRIKCRISSTLLTGYLGSKSAIKNDEVEKLYEEKRSDIEAAFQRAYLDRPSDSIELQERDFRRARA